MHEDPIEENDIEEEDNQTERKARSKKKTYNLVEDFTSATDLTKYWTEKNYADSFKHHSDTHAKGGETITYRCKFYSIVGYVGYERCDKMMNPHRDVFGTFIKSKNMI